MNEEMMTTGFTGGDAATGPTAGYDPVMKFRRKLKDKRKEVKKGYHVMPDGTMMPGETHLEETDHEVSMAQSQLKTSKENITKLQKRLGKKKKNIPAWVQSKITDTAHNTDAAASYTKEEVDRHNHTPSRLYQYKVTIPTVGETILYANSPAELMQKLRLLINPRMRADISIERIMPSNAAKFFYNKRMKHMKNIIDEAEDKQLQAQVTQQQINLEKQKVNAKIKAMQMQLQKKTAALKAKARVGGAQQTVDQG